VESRSTILRSLQRSVPAIVTTREGEVLAASNEITSIAVLNRRGLQVLTIMPATRGRSNTHFTKTTFTKTERPVVHGLDVALALDLPI
jgi:hypothetical protein